jgi:ectoine hydroxylase-related dioxygenase (phytanoyl-CoA dioxygenase family)
MDDSHDGIVSRLSPEQISTFRRRGFVKIGRILTDNELATIRNVVEKAQSDSSAAKPYVSGHEDDYNRRSAKEALKALRDLRFSYPEQEAVVRQARIAALPRDLMGCEHVLLWSESVLVKIPQDDGGAPTPWHQDFPIVPLDSRDQVNMWIALEDVAADQGALEFLPGSHRVGPLGGSDWTADCDLRDRMTPEDLELVGEPELVPLNAGEAVAFGPLMVHHAGPNTTSRERRGLTWYWVSSEIKYTGMPFFKTDGLSLEIGQPLRHERFPQVV